MEKTIFNTFPLEGVKIGSGFKISSEFQKLATSYSPSGDAMRKARSEAKRLMKPRKQVIIKNDSSNLNHLHAVLVRVHN